MVVLVEVGVAVKVLVVSMAKVVTTFPADARVEYGLQFFLATANFVCDSLDWNRLQFLCYLFCVPFERMRMNIEQPLNIH